MIRRYWQRSSGYIDAKSLRERTMVFLMIATALGALLHLALFDPLLSKQARLTRTLKEHETRIGALHMVAQTTLTQHRVDPNAATRVRIEALKARLASVDRTLGSLGSQVVPPQQMPRLLQSLVAQNRGLQLASIKTIPATDLVSEPIGPAASASSNPAKVPIYKHGVEIQVIGGYHDLLDYMTQLERLPWRMYWNDAHLKVESFPLSRLTLRLYTLSLEKSWLAV